jgi:hypothetical protein
MPPTRPAKCRLIADPAERKPGEVVYRHKPTDELWARLSGSRSGGRRVGLKGFLVLQEMLRSWRLTSRMKRSMLAGMQ